MLIVEVSETSAEYDRNVKIPMYSRAGIAEAWLVSLADQWIEVYREPSQVGYRSIRRMLPGESLAAQAFPEDPVNVSDFVE